MINNFDNVRMHLDFSNPDYFYLVSMIGRKKDGWDKDITLTSFKIDSLEKFNLYEKRIKAISEATNTRAYISASPKSKKGVAKLMLCKVTQLYTEEQYGIMNHVYDSAADSNEVSKRFILDVDDKPTIDIITSIEKYLTSIYISFWINPSVSGIHFITEPFNLTEFVVKFPNIDVKKRAKTLLYYKEK